MGRVAPPRHFGGELDTHQDLLRTIHRIIPKLGRGRRSLHRVEAGVLIEDQHPVGNPGGRGLIPDLPVDRVRAEERQVDARVTCAGGRVDHLVGPVLVVAGRQEGFVVAQLAAIGMGVDIGRVGHVVARPFEPADQLDLPVEEQAGAVIGEWPLE